MPTKTGKIKNFTMANASRVVSLGKDSCSPLSGVLTNIAPIHPISEGEIEQAFARIAKDFQEWFESSQHA